MGVEGLSGKEGATDLKGVNSFKDGVAGRFFTLHVFFFIRKCKFGFSLEVS